MVWAQIDVNKPHLVYIVLGGFTTLFMLCSSVIKERLYIGEATVATLCGIIFGPHAAGLVDPNTWGNTDQITLEFSRVVLVVQCFAVGVELPRAYMERHWKSVVFLLVPVMTVGWLVTALFVWALLGTHLNFLDSLVVAACVTATDPVLASSVVGKGKFAKRVPKHLRDLLSAESGCNDGMAFPFIYLALYLVRYRPEAGTVTWHWIGITILYECIFGAIYGVFVGYVARRAIRFAHERDLIDRESFLVFYFVLALFCAGSGSILGIDDLLVGFACGVGFSNDGWFLEKTEEAHVSNVIDLLINLAFFVYFGTIIPWSQFNSDIIGTSPWRLVVIAVLVLLFRRIPIMMALKPLIPDIKTWREALFAGHFGPIGVGAIFVAIMARAELETDSTTPLAVLPEPGFEHLNIIELIWPITTFLVMASIIVHGSSIAVFTLGKHINTLTITMSYTQAQDEGNWMDRLPRIQSRSKTNTSMRKPDASEESLDEKMPDYPAAALGLPRNFLRRQKEEDNPSRATSRTRRKKWNAGPIEQSAIAPQSRREDSQDSDDNEKSGSDTLANKGDESPDNQERRGSDPQVEVYDEGDDVIFEDEDGEVLDVMESREGETDGEKQQRIKDEATTLMSDEEPEHGNPEKTKGSGKGLSVNESRKDRERETMGERAEHAIKNAYEGSGGKSMKHMMGTWGGLKRDKGHEQREEPPPKKEKTDETRPRRGGPARAYRFGRTIIVEDEDGEVIKQYDIPAPERTKLERNTSYVNPEKTRQTIRRMSTWLGVSQEPEEAEAGPSGAKPQAKRKMSTKANDQDDDRIRFTMDGQTQRMNKEDFIRQIQGLDPRSRAQVVEWSDAPERVKQEARADAREHDSIRRRAGDAPTKPMTDGQSGGDAAVQRVLSNEDRMAGPDGLTLVDSHGQDIPFFQSWSGDLGNSLSGSETAAQQRRRTAAQQGEGGNVGSSRRSRRVQAERTATSYFSMPRTSNVDSGETAAERRRREGAFGITKEEDEEEDNGGRVGRARSHSSPRRPTNADTETAAERRRREGAFGVSREEDEGARSGRARAHSSPKRSKLDQKETAAERRRREGALGVSKEESDSDEDVSAPRDPPPNAVSHSPPEVKGPGIRFADPEPRAGTSSRLRWGQNRGR